ncbi:MAG: acyl-CoA/acyl-ACP dehydrogenase [Gammaproteobacteria bacterium]|nr:acyl-CoA/acyl-ACP dehydrogenase [Gammaproteobacteria bacterium]
MDIALPEDAACWRETARRFAQEELIPNEIEAEMNNGLIAPDKRAHHQRLALELGFSRMDVPKAHGGLELGMTGQVAVWEQLGRVTNGLCWCFCEPQQWMFEACTPDQLQRYVLPLMRGERHDCYAITEAEPGSQEVINTTATRCPGGYRVNGEKWYVTGANFADFMWLQARLDSGASALLLVDMDSPGLEIVRTPLFSHTFASHHPIYRLADVVVPDGNRVGSDGAGLHYMRSWFRHERMMIAARCCGAAARLIEEAHAFAQGRMLDGEPLSSKQAIQFMLADSVTELWAARLMTYEAASAHDQGADLKSLHGRCSMVKLYASEMANRVADRAVQIFGGRGYMRENVAERFFRELRVDRIWEGTSEIQRLIIAGHLNRRGLRDM